MGTVMNLSSLLLSVAINDWSGFMTHIVWKVLHGETESATAIELTHNTLMSTAKVESIMVGMIYLYFLRDSQLNIDVQFSQK
jgi:hypothetical protein